jgi:hypothetical protein
MGTVSINTLVDIDLYEFDDDDLVAELEDRGYTVISPNETQEEEMDFLRTIHGKMMLGLDYTEDLRTFLQDRLGVVIP